MPVEQIELPVGRIVWGNPAKSTVKTNYTTKQPVLKDGQQVLEWVCGIAIPKAEFDQQVRPLMDQEARSVYPNGTPPEFSWKITDGDGVDQQGNRFADREGYAGHYIIKISTEAFAPPIFKYEGNQYVPVTEEAIKTGDYVVSNITIKAHTNNSGGLYLNPNGFELVGYGTAIVSSSTNPNELFTRKERQLPPGASATPLSSAPAGVGMPQQQAVPAPQQYQAPAPQTVNAQLPPPAQNFPQSLGNAPQMPGTPPAQTAPQQPQQFAQTPGGYTAPPATGYPTNQG